MLLHHVGIIVNDVEKAAEQLPKGILINDVYDPLQDARLVLYENFGTSYLELIQPLSVSSPTWNQLKVNNLKPCVVGLFADPERLSDIRRNRVAIMNDNKLVNYTDLSAIKKEVEKSKMLFKKYNWPTIDVTRKSVEETAVSIIKIYDIRRSK